MANNKEGINIDITSIILVLILVVGGYFAKQEYDKYKQREAAAAEMARLESEKRRLEIEAQRAAAEELREAKKKANLEQERLAQERAALEKVEAERKRNSSVAAPEPAPLPKIETLSAAELEQASQARERGKQFLRESEKQPQLVVNAANEFAAAAELYERGGPEEDAAETNSYLYWCKKEMTSELAQAYIKTEGITAAVAKRLDDAVKDVSKDEARVFFKRAEDFGSAYPQEFMLISMRYFEVANRFRGTEVGRVAMERSLRAMHLAASSRTSSQPANTPPAAPEQPARSTVKVTEAAARQRSAVENAAQAAIGNSYRAYMFAFNDAASRIKPKEASMKESSVIIGRDTTGQAHKQFSQELYDKQYANALNPFRPMLDPLWKTVETKRETFLATYIAAVHDKPTDESKSALLFANDICEKQYKKLH